MILICISCHGLLDKKILKVKRGFFSWKPGCWVFQYRKKSIQIYRVQIFCQYKDHTTQSYTMQCIPSIGLTQCGSKFMNEKVDFTEFWVKTWKFRKSYSICLNQAWFVSYVICTCKSWIGFNLFFSDLSGHDDFVVPTLVTRYHELPRLTNFQ